MELGEWKDSRCVVQKELIGCADRQDVRIRQREKQNIYTASGVTNSQDRHHIYSR